MAFYKDSRFRSIINHGGAMMFVKTEEVPSALITAGKGVIEYVGKQPTVTAGVNIDAGKGIIEYIGKQPVVDVGKSVNITAGKGVLEYVGKQPSVSAGVNIAAGKGVIEVIGKQPTVDTGSTTVVEDTFAGTNGDKVAGRSPDTVDPGATWAEVHLFGSGSQNWEIQSNKAEPVGQNSNVQVVGATIDSGESDCTVTSDFTTGSQNGLGFNGIVVRFTDGNNYWRVQKVGGSSEYQIVEVDGGTATSRAITDAGLMTETTYAFEIVMNGTTITARIDGGSEISYDSATVNQTATKHGFCGPHRNSQSAKPLVDNFKVVT